MISHTVSVNFLSIPWFLKQAVIPQPELGHTGSPLLTLPLAGALVDNSFGTLAKLKPTINLFLLCPQATVVKFSQHSRIYSLWQSSTAFAVQDSSCLIGPRQCFRAQWRQQQPHWWWCIQFSHFHLQDFSSGNNKSIEGIIKYPPWKKSCEKYLFSGLANRIFF